MRTSHYITLIIFSFLTSTATYGQQKDVKNYAVFKIKKIYQQINQYKNYKTITIDEVENFTGHNTDNGGSLTGYYKGDSLKKIVEWIGHSNKVIQNEYYLNNDKLAFVYSTERMYKFNKKTFSFDYSKLDDISKKGRYYFDNEKLIDAILSNKERNDTQEEDATNFISTSKEYMQLLKEKRKK